MNTHKNARLTFVRRLDMVVALTSHQLSLVAAADRFGVSPATARKWLGRYLAEGQAGLADRSSRPQVSPRSIAAATALTVVELRKKRMTQARIANYLGISKATVSRVLGRAGLSKLSDLAPAEPVVRYEHAHAGDLIHLDTKKLVRIERPGHRVHGDRTTRVSGAGWEVLFVAIDDHARIAFTRMYRDETKNNAIDFLGQVHAWLTSLDVKPKAILTDNGSAFRSKAFGAAVQALELKARFTRPYRPQTNGKAERFIQSALREWAYGFVYQHSNDRTAMLERWLHHYNWHRPHQGIGSMTPMSRLRATANNLLQLHI
jgi:transposase InsO family protein